MNYAQDALFWYLYNPQVRALATLLTAPAPIIYENEISVKELLGENGFRFLKQLDENPQLLLSHLKPTDDIKNNAQQLLNFWLKHSPNSQELSLKQIYFSFNYYTQNNFSGSLKENTLTRGFVCVPDKRFSPYAWHCPVIQRLPEIQANECWVNLTWAEQIAPVLRTADNLSFTPPKQTQPIAVLTQNPDNLWREKERFMFNSEQ